MVTTNPVSTTNESSGFHLLEFNSGPSSSWAQVLPVLGLCLLSIALVYYVYRKCCCGHPDFGTPKHDPWGFNEFPPHRWHNQDGQWAIRPRHPELPADIPWGLPSIPAQLHIEEIHDPPRSECSCAQNADTPSLHDAFSLA